jgi:FkbM family methyltransferase
MVNIVELVKALLAEVEWALTSRLYLNSEDEAKTYKIWAKARRNLFKKWGNIPTIGSENRRWEFLKNKYHGERIFIVGNGPSLNNTSLNKLEGEYTFGVNRIYLLFNKIDWQPTFYTINDWEVAPDNAQEIKALEDMIFFFPKRFKGLFKSNDTTYWYNSRHPRFKGDDFSYDLTDGAVMGGSVLTLAIQIAYYLGFEPIYLIGVDVDYKILDTVEQSGTKRFANGNLQFLKSTQDDDPNHFDPRYFGKGRRWHNPNIECMIEGFKVCREAIERKGGHIYNATVGGKLEVMERVDFNSIFEQEFNPPPKVSIIMPAYNAEPFIGEAINSVLAQTYKDWELIIVNDGSQDNTQQIIESYKDPRIICIIQENAGRAVARNTALKRVRGEYITFLDADDFYMPENLELQVRFLREHEEAGAVVGGVIRVAENGRIIKFKVYPDGQIISTQSFLTGNPVHIQSTIFRRQWVNSSVLFNPAARAGEDWEFNIQIALAGCTFVRQSVVVCSYRCTEQAKRKTTEQYAEAMVSVVDRIFSSMGPESIYQNMEKLARYHVNLRMAARFFSTEQYEQGQKYLIKALNYTNKSFDETLLYDSISNAIVGWLIQFDVAKPLQILKTAIGYLPDTLDKKRIKKDSQVKLRKNAVFYWGIGSWLKLLSILWKNDTTITYKLVTKILRGNGFKASEDKLTVMSQAYTRKQHAHINETRLVFELSSSFPSGSVMLDVGAHFGGSLEPFAKKGWQVYAFEPDPGNREKLMSRIQNYKTVCVDSRAVSDCSQDSLPFFSSPVSFGISSLHPFHDSHQETCKVSTTTIADICQDNKLTAIDFLKIDAEGHDLMVLQGIPWKTVQPRIVECEFEDAKTVPLGYCFDDIAQYLVDKGYFVLVSEWHPIIEYGKRHDWHRLVAYPCKLNSNSWGNLIAFREMPDMDKVFKIANQLTKTNPEQNHFKIIYSLIDSKNKIWRIITKLREKLIFNVASLQLTSLLLGRIANYYSRWPVLLALLAISLNIAAMLDSPYRWAFITGGTSILLFLIGHSASKAEFALETADNASQKVNLALKKGKNAVHKAKKTSETVNLAFETINEVSQTVNLALEIANKASATADSAFKTANQASQAVNCAVDTANQASQAVNCAVDTANQASQFADTAATQLKQIFTQSNSLNVGIFQRFDRQLSRNNLERIMSFWIPTLDLKLNRRAIGYLAHKICLSEDNCSGRLATSVQDMLLRILVARSTKSQYLSVIEIGALFGISLGTIYETCRGCFKNVHLTAIDPLEGYYDKSSLDIITQVPISRNVLEHNMRQMDVVESDITIIQELSTNESALKKAGDKRYNLLIIDGDHSYIGVKFDFEHYYPLIEPGGFIIFDDYNQQEWPDVTKFVDEEVKPHSGVNFIGADWRTAVFQVKL